MEHLSSDVLEEIFSWLPFKSIGTLATVSTRWRDFTRVCRCFWHHVSVNSGHPDFLRLLSDHSKDVTSLEMHHPPPALHPDAFPFLQKATLKFKINHLLKITQDLSKLTFLDLTGNLNFSPLLLHAPHLEFLRIKTSNASLNESAEAILGLSHLRILDVDFSSSPPDVFLDSNPHLHIISTRERTPHSRVLSKSIWDIKELEELKHYGKFVKDFPEFGRWMLFVFLWLSRDVDLITYLVREMGVSAGSVSPQYRGVWSPFKNLIENDAIQLCFGKKAYYALYPLLADSFNPCNSSGKLRGFPEFESVCNFLLSNGCHINARDSDGMTALNYASRMDNFEKLLFLVNAGADPNIVDNDGKCPLYYIITNNLVHAEKSTEMLLNAGAKVNITKPPLLAHAWSTLKYRIIRLLLDHGAVIDSEVKSDNPWYRMMSKESPLVFGDDCTKIANLLIDLGVSTSEVDEEGETPLIRACKKRYFDIAKVIVERTDSLELLNFQEETTGWAPIHHLVRWCSISVVRGGKANQFSTRSILSFPVSPPEPPVFEPVTQREEIFYNLTASGIYSGFSPEELRWAFLCRKAAGSITTLSQSSKGKIEVDSSNKLIANGGENEGSKQVEEKAHEETTGVNFMTSPPPGTFNEIVTKSNEVDQPVPTPPKPEDSTPVIPPVITQDTSNLSHLEIEDKKLHLDLPPATEFHSDFEEKSPKKSIQNVDVDQKHSLFTIRTPGGANGNARQILRKHCLKKGLYKKTVVQGSSSSDSSEGEFIRNNQLEDNEEESPRFDPDTLKSKALNAQKTVAPVPVETQNQPQTDTKEVLKRSSENQPDLPTQPTQPNQQPTTTAPAPALQTDITQPKPPQGIQKKRKSIFGELGSELFGGTEKSIFDSSLGFNESIFNGNSVWTNGVGGQSIIRNAMIPVTLINMPITSKIPSPPFTSNSSTSDSDFPISGFGSVSNTSTNSSFSSSNPSRSTDTKNPMVQKVEPVTYNWQMNADAFDVLELLRKRVDVNSLTKRKETPLLLCLRTSTNVVSVHVASLLLESNADLSICDEDGTTTLHAAVFRLDQKLLNLILEHWTGPIDPVDKYGATPLLQACKLLGSLKPNGTTKEDWDCIQTLLVRGANLQAQEKYTKRSSLHYLALCNTGEHLSLLNNFPVDFNTRDIFGFTPLRLAVEVHNWSMIITFSNTHRCSHTALCYRSQTPFLRVLEMISFSCTPLLIDCGFPSQGSFTFAAETVIETLTNSAMYPICPRPNQWNPTSLMTGNLDITPEVTKAVICLSERYDYHVPGNRGLYALHWILPMLCFSELKLLHNEFRQIVQSASAQLLNSQDEVGDTPLAKLVKVLRQLNKQGKYAEIQPQFITQVITKGASCSIPNRDGTTVLMLASEFTHSITDQLITIADSENINYQHPVTKETALHVFIRNRRYLYHSFTGQSVNTRKFTQNHELLQSLLKVMDPNVFDSSGLTPLMIACQYFYYDWIVEIASCKNCNINLQNPLTGQTALHYLSQRAEPIILNELQTEKPIPDPTVPSPASDSPDFHAKKTKIHTSEPEPKYISNIPNALLLHLIALGANPNIPDKKGQTIKQITPFLFQED